MWLRAWGVLAGFVHERMATRREKPANFSGATIRTRPGCLCNTWLANGGMPGKKLLFCSWQIRMMSISCQDAHKMQKHDPSRVTTACVL